MPYIPQHRRDALERGTNRIETAGELNYCLTRTALNYLHNEPVSYQRINDVMGAFHAAVAEFYRRVAVPYEDEKRRVSGDVY